MKILQPVLKNEASVLYEIKVKRKGVIPWSSKSLIRSAKKKKTLLIGENQSFDELSLGGIPIVSNPSSDKNVMLCLLEDKIKIR